MPYSIQTTISTEHPLTFYCINISPPNKVQFERQKFVNLKDIILRVFYSWLREETHSSGLLLFYWNLIKPIENRIFPF